MENEIKKKEKKIKKEKQKKIIAKAKYIRTSPKKIRLVINVIRGMDVEEAENQLKFISKRACQPVLKLLNSAVANAKHDFDLKKENLYIKEIIVNQGPTLDRWMPRAFGRAAPIRKKTSHIIITLDKKEKGQIIEKLEKKEEEKVEKIAIAEDKKEVISDKEIHPVKSDKTDIKQQIKTKDKRGFIKKVFNRKSG
ncbi:MAG: 50S ribosomal protein L22 [Candidatus Kuenenbacteria bacterium]